MFYISLSFRVSRCFCEDLSWQTSLASSAVSAAEDVRATVRAFRTASNARATASSAALSAQLVCEKAEFATMEDARAAQTRSSIAQSHAIHAAVVEHEAKTIKRRATLALAHDVKTWNIHRKREMLRSCIAYAKAQHEATRRAVDSWSSLRDGFIGAAMAPATVDRRHHVSPTPMSSLERRRPQIEPDEVTATIFEHSIQITQQQAIMAVEHNILSSLGNQTPTEISSSSIEVQEPETFLPVAETASYLDDNRLQEPCFNQFAISDIPFYSQDALPRAPEIFESCSFELEPRLYQALPSDTSSTLIALGPNVPKGPELCFEQDHEDVFDATEALTSGMNENKESFDKVDSSISAEAGNIFDDDAVGDLVEFRRGFSKQDVNVVHSNEEKLSESMQSLVDGLMTWGYDNPNGGFEAEEVHFALPAGMATAIALEGSDAIGSDSFV